MAADKGPLHQFEINSFYDIKLYNKIKEYSIKNFLPDKNCPVSYEPSGTDFLSPCLAEAALMSTILDKKKFNVWFK